MCCFWPHWPEARVTGSGAGPLPVVTGAPPQRASGADRTAAPKAGHNPVVELWSLPGIRRSCWHGSPPDWDYLHTAAGGTPAPGRGKGQHGGCSHWGPFCGYRRSYCGCPPLPCAPGWPPARQAAPIYRAAHPGRAFSRPCYLPPQPFSGMTSFKIV